MILCLLATLHHVQPRRRQHTAPCPRVRSITTVGQGDLYCFIPEKQSWTDLSRTAFPQQHHPEEKYEPSTETIPFLNSDAVRRIAGTLDVKKDQLGGSFSRLQHRSPSKQSRTKVTRHPRGTLWPIWWLFCRELRPTVAKVSITTS
jgi:hypothetical protein